MIFETPGQVRVMEHFYTIQGEGYYQGAAAYFIRLGGCDVGCTWCDVKESWDANKHPLMDVTMVCELVKSSGAQMAVVTGGEPLLHNCLELTKTLHSMGIRTNIETSGSAAFSGVWDWVCLSPKKFKEPLPENLAKADELKIIVYNNDDFKWAEKFAAHMKPGCKLYLQPEWSRKEIMMPKIVQYVLANPAWEISVQVHKYIGVD